MTERSSTTSVSKTHLHMPTPSIEQVKLYLERWNQTEEYVRHQEALHRLFVELFPENTNLSHVLIKASILNSLYSTNIFKIFPVAKHIVSLDIDRRLQAGDVDLVADIQRVNKRSFYSFATKYCSFHQPQTFPIYDSFVEKILCHFRKRDSFASFRNNELKDYKRFKSIMIEFRLFYGLDQFGFKEMDQYLWQAGKEYFPKK